LGRVVRRQVRCAAVRPDQHLLETDVDAGPRICANSATAATAGRLPPSGHRADRHARRLPAELRGARGQYRRLDDLERVPWTHRAALRARHRIWVMDRGIPTEDSLAQMRAKGGVVPGGHTQGATDQARTGIPRSALGARAPGRARQAAGHRGGRVRAGNKAMHASTRNAACGAGGCAVTLIGCESCRVRR